MARSNRRNTRATKVREGSSNRGTTTSRKYTAQEDTIVTEHYVQSSLPEFRAANDRQKLALRMLNEGRSMVFLTGSAGTGKSMLAAYHAARKLKQKVVNKIYLVRPNVHCGKSIGMLKGTLEEKMTPFFTQIVSHLSYFMGQGYTQYALEKEVIEYVAFEYIRGVSLEDAIVIVEEAQGLTAAEFETCLTRLGKNAQFIFTGDIKQVDQNVQSGLKHTVDLICRVLDEEPDYLDDEDLNALEDNLGVVEFTEDDVVRSGVTRALVKIFNRN